MSAPKRRPQPARRRASSPAGPVYVTRQVHFNAAHRLHNPAFGRRWNERTYGLCASPHGHGHNYVLEATVAGAPDPDTGYVIDLARLKDILNRAVADRVDHRNLNTDVDFLRRVIPTTENLVVAFWNEIAPRIAGGRLHALRLYETPRNFVDYFGPGGRP
ncbi:MAG TPA: 6-carboxytetrahydropterin synthase [Opitutaceae bacterium]|nr:6-carboxytetrahydropterin synthase [Opitutaceae bacterium]